jgi:hypothetical protein
MKRPWAVRQYRALDPVALLTEMGAVQEELGNRVDRRAGSTALRPVQSSAPDPDAFAKALGTTVKAGDPRGTLKASI